MLDRLRYGPWRYHVADDHSQCAGNLPRHVALNFAEGWKSLHPERTVIVSRRRVRGRVLEFVRSL